LKANGASTQTAASRKPALFVAGVVFIVGIAMIAGSNSRSGAASAGSGGQDWMTSSSYQSSHHLFSLIPYDASKPFGDQGESMSLADADSLPAGKLPLPEVESIASDSSISGVWRNQGDGEIWVEYASGIDISAAAWDSPLTPDEQWKSMLADPNRDNQTLGLVTVDGEDMLLFPPNDLGSGSIEFVLAGTKMVILGNYVLTVDGLEGLAASAVENAKGA
jgi:hypothetical protein